jgi:hypothetical protein
MYKQVLRLKGLHKSMHWKEIDDVPSGAQGSLHKLLKLNWKTQVILILIQLTRR